MDIAILLIIVGCALAGVVWGAVKIASVAVALTAAIIAGRFAGGPIAQLIAKGPQPDSGEHALATIGVGLVAFILVALAGRGLRRALQALHMTWLDRIAGAFVAGGGAAVTIAVLLAFASQGGWNPPTPWALALAGVGRTALSFHHIQPASSAMPSSTPPKPTSAGQHPH